MKGPCGILDKERGSINEVVNALTGELEQRETQDDKQQEKLTGMIFVGIPSRCINLRASLSFQGNTQPKIGFPSYSPI